MKLEMRKYAVACTSCHGLDERIKEIAILWNWDDWVMIEEEEKEASLVF